MRLNLHDFSGHPFQVQLSRALAARGHDVLHGYATQYVTGHGRLETGADDPDSLRIEGLTCPAPMIKYSPVGRTRFELSYAAAWQEALDAEEFDLVVACNLPLFSMARMRRYFARKNQPWVLWHQDLQSLGVGSEAARKFPGPLAGLARTAVERLEAAQVRSAAGVVAIAEGMVSQYGAWNINRPGVHVIPNWAPLDEVTPGPRDNAWAREQGLPESGIRLMYAGTLGRKHNPLLLLRVLDACREAGVDATLTVVSEGVGADDLAAAAQGRSDVRILGFQPAERMSEMLASADVVIALLEPDAAQFSVPSKVFSYLSAGRAIVALVPDGNPSATDVRAAGGFADAPTDAGARRAATWIASVCTDPAAVGRLGARARDLACQRFDIERISDRFEQILSVAAGRPARTDGRPLAVIDGVGATDTDPRDHELVDLGLARRTAMP